MANEFTGKNGRPVQVGDILTWEAPIGTVEAVVLRYDTTDDPDVLPGMLRRLYVRLPNGNESGYLYAHDVAQMESRPAA